MDHRFAEATRLLRGFAYLDLNVRWFADGAMDRLTWGNRVNDGGGKDTLSGAWSALIGLPCSPIAFRRPTGHHTFLGFDVCGLAGRGHKSIGEILLLCFF